MLQLTVSLMMRLVRAAIGVITPGGAGIGRTGPVGSAVTDARFSITPEFGLCVMGFLIDEPGGGYLKKADGSLGGSGRTWSEAGSNQKSKRQMVHIYSHRILVL